MGSMPPPSQQPLCGPFPPHSDPYGGPCPPPPPHLGPPLTRLLQAALLHLSAAQLLVGLTQGIALLQQPLKSKRRDKEQQKMRRNMRRGPGEGGRVGVSPPSPGSVPQSVPAGCGIPSATAPPAGPPPPAARSAPPPVGGGAHPDHAPRRSKAPPTSPLTPAHHPPGPAPAEATPSIAHSSDSAP